MLMVIIECCYIFQNKSDRNLSILLFQADPFCLRVKVIIFAQDIFKLNKPEY